MSRTPARPCSAASVLAAALVLLGTAPAAEAVVLVGNMASFSWAAANGPVAGYRVYVARNGVSGATPEMAVTSTSATVAGQYDDELSVRVAAFDGSGNQGPLSSWSETVVLAAPAPTGPPYVVVEATGDFSIQQAIQTAAGEQVVAHMNGEGQQLLDTSPPEGTPDGEPFGLDQLVVGSPGQATTVRLLEAMDLDQSTPLADLPTITLAGLGNGPPCQRDGAPGLVIHPGSQLILGGIDLLVFDGETCVHVNEMFPGSPDPNVVAFGDGSIALHGDLEGDGVPDPEDNCLIAANPSQCDGDRDGFGNTCDFDIDNNGAVGLEDLSAFMRASRVVSTDPVFDFNCDGAVGLTDSSLMRDGMQQAPGPSGLACAANASCSPTN